MNNTRQYYDPSDTKAKDLLDCLLANKEVPESYRKAMYDIGVHMGSMLKSKISKKENYCVVVTVEDADFLGKGIIDSINSHVNNIYTACFWNYRQKISGIHYAPIYNKYIEKGCENSDKMIVVKSILSGSCVVKTNISALVDKVSPSDIYIVAPVIYKDSIDKLKENFSDEINELFSYYYLAEDHDKNGDTVIPGIGGSVYELLGLKNHSAKNKIIPQLVKEKLFCG